MKQGDQGLIIHKLNDKIAGQNEEIIKLKKLLKEYEQWEADLINEDKLWWPNVAKDFLRGPLYDKMLDLQSKRNDLLK